MSPILTDIHAHVLPGVDDGPGTITDALLLTDMYTDCGVSQVFCTPHYRNPAYHVPVEVARDAFGSLESQRATRPLNATTLDLVVGAEVHLAPGFADDLRQNLIPTLGDTHYVLVEFPNTELPDHSLRWIHELTIRGYRPIMAHPERHLVLRQDPKRVEDLTCMGVLMQLTAMCFLPESDGRSTAQSRGSSHATHRHDAKNPVNQFAWQLLTQGHGTVIASDAHGTTRRPPRLKSAYEEISHRLGENVAETLIQNANAIWNDEEVTAVTPTVAETKKGWFRRK